MKTAAKKELKKYLFPSIGGIVCGCLCLGIGIFLMAMSVNAWPMLLGCTAFAALVSWQNVADILSLNKQLKQMEENGNLENALTEFASGRQFLNDAIRVSSRYLFGKKSAQIVSYGQIKKIYQHVHKTNFVEDRRELRVETTAGKIVSVCRLPLRGKGDTEMVQIVSLVKAMNPSASIGYR